MFKTITNINYTLPELSDVQFAVYGLNGSLVYSKKLGQVKGGAHSIRWNTADNSGVSVPNGVYVCKITSAFGTKKQTLSVMR